MHFDRGKMNPVNKLGYKGVIIGIVQGMDAKPAAGALASGKQGRFSGMRKSTIIGMLAAAVAVSFVAEAGTLRIGQPTLHGDQVSVPVVLEGNVAGGVAALSFQLNYDPAAVEPVQARPGAAAQSAGKEVMTNVPDPGTYMVVMAGLNSDTMHSGDVTHIVFQRRGDYNSTNISITGTTFASLQGDEIPSRGSTGSILFTQDEAQEPEESRDEPEQAPRETDEAPELPGEQDGVPPPESVSPDPAGVAPSRQTQRPAQISSERGTAEGAQAPWPATGTSSRGENDETREDADTDRRLADALTAAARSRSGIAGRPSQAPSATEESEPERREDASRTLETTAGTRMAAITEADTAAASAEGEEGTPLPRDPATTPAEEESPPTVSQPAGVPPPVLPDEAVRDAGETAAPSGTTRTLVFLVVVIAVVIGIVVLRRRLFT